MPKRVTTFQKEWMDPDLNLDWALWVRPGGMDTKASCTYCKKEFSVSTMGHQALISHVKGDKHQGNKPQRSADQLSLKCFGTTSKEQWQPIVAHVENEESEPTVSGSTNMFVNQSSTASSSKELNLDNQFILRDNVLRAEIIASLNAVDKYLSYKSYKGYAAVLKAMFPDSTIAKSISIRAQKVAYVISFGLAPYFTKLLKAQLCKSPVFVACFDGAFNKISQKGQMDLVIRYWDESDNMVKNRYLTSVFLGHATAADIFKKFMECISGLKLSNLIQISMDGPNVNLKFFRDFKEFYAMEVDSALLDVGTCSLHIVHGAFQTGHKQSGWNVNSVLQAMYYVFKDSPAWRDDFTKITGSTKFAKKFCYCR